MQPHRKVAQFRELIAPVKHQWDHPECLPIPLNNRHLRLQSLRWPSASIRGYNASRTGRSPCVCIAVRTWGILDGHDHQPSSESQVSTTMQAGRSSLHRLGGRQTQRPLKKRRFCLGNS